MNTTSVFEDVPLGTSDRAAKFLQAAWSAMEMNELREVPQNELCRHLGIAPGTLINWVTKTTELHQIEAMMRLLERLPDDTRRRLLERFLRLRPTIESTRFAHEPTSVSRLRSLIRQRNGVTFIEGADARTYLITALGHSLQQLFNREGAIAGVDIHAPDWFVPVPGVDYLAFPTGSAKLREEVARAWPRPEHAAAVLMNGVWSLMPERQQQVISWSANHHVLIADEVKYAAKQRQKVFRDLKVPVHFLSVTVMDQQRMHLEFQSP